MYVIVVGGGRLGTYLTSLLIAGGHKVKLVARPEELARTQPDLPEEALVKGRRTDPHILESIGIRQANVVAAVTDSDETNLVVTSLARFEFGVPRVIARVNNPNNSWMFTPQMGVDVALNQADLMAHLIEEEMSLGDMITLLKLRKGKFSLVEEKVHPDSVAVGKTVDELNLPIECVLVAAIRDGHLLIPRGDTVLQATDEVLMLVHQSALKQIGAKLGRRNDPAG